jgi:hypothetical protein
MVHTHFAKDHVLDNPEPFASHGQAPCAPLHGPAPLALPPHLPMSLEQLLVT